MSSETEEVGGPFTLSIATFRLYCDIDVKQLVRFLTFFCNLYFVFAFCVLYFVFLSFCIFVLLSFWFAALTNCIESIAWEQIEPPHLIVGSGSDVALPVQEARIHNIHCRPVEGCRHNLLQGGDGDRGEGVRDQVRHCPRLLPG